MKKDNNENQYGLDGEMKEIFEDVASNETSEEVEFNNFSVDETEESIPFEVEDDLIEEPDYNAMPENEVPFATDESFIEQFEDDYPVEDEPVREQRVRRKQTKKKMNKKKKIAIITISSVLVVILGVLALGSGFVNNFLGKTKISDEDPIYKYMTQLDTSQIEKLEKINILLLGVDKDGERSDSIMLMNYNIKTNKITLISIPRDTRIFVEDRRKNRKITEVHGMHDKDGEIYGASAVAQAVINMTGMPINYYVEFSFEALDGIMDKLGPVKFDVPDLEGKGRGMNYEDPAQDLAIHLKPGMQELSGNQIQQFLRYRKSMYKDAENVNGSDIARVERQQELLGAIMDQKLNASLIAKAPGIFDEASKHLKTTFSPDDILIYAQFLLKDERYKSISSENMESYVLPGEDKLVNGISYFLCDLEETADLVTTEFGYEVVADDLTNAINLSGKSVSGKSDSKSDLDDEEDEVTSSSGKKKTSSENKVISEEDEEDEERVEVKKGTSKPEKEDSKTESKTNTATTKKTTTKTTTTKTTTNNNDTVKKKNDNSTENKTETGTKQKESSDKSSITDKNSKSGSTAGGNNASSNGGTSNSGSTSSTSDTTGGATTETDGKSSSDTTSSSNNSENKTASNGGSSDSGEKQDN